MFGKLLRHELYATGRVALPLLGAVPLLALLSHFALRFAVVDSRFGMVTGMVLLLYGLSVFAAFVGMAVLLIQRFRRSVLGDEGYLTMTLPVSLHAVLWAKALTALLWCLASAVTAPLSVALVGVDGWDDLPALLRGLFESGGPFHLTPGEAALWAAQGTASALQVILLFYAAMAVGHSFHSHKGLLSVLSFFLLNGVIRSAMMGLLYGQLASMDAARQLRLFSAATLAGSLLFCALLYAITYYFLKKRLNLQ